LCGSDRYRNSYRCATKESTAALSKGIEEKSRVSLMDLLFRVCVLEFGKEAGNADVQQNLEWSESHGKSLVWAGTGPDLQILFTVFLTSSTG